MVEKIVGVPTFGEGGLQSQVNPRFGRCDSFTFVKLVDNKVASIKVISNAAAGAMGGAGIQAAQLMGNNDATDIIVGMLGPNAFQSLSALNLKIFQIGQQDLTVNDAIKLLTEGKLTQLTNSNVQAHFGMGGGMGGGRGMGRGMGGGGGRGRGGQF
jgi:predicted Fe-Mo cluster-binding NifX family protein